MKPQIQRPTGAFVAASWAALLVGAVTYLVGLWNAGMALNEKGYYLTIVLAAQAGTAGCSIGHELSRNSLSGLLPS